MYNINFFNTNQIFHFQILEMEENNHLNKKKLNL